MWPFGGENDKKKPDMSANSRITCYNNRDHYFECLEKNGDASEMCQGLQKEYNKTCLEAWRSYFEIQRKRLKAQGKPWASPNMEGEKGTKTPVRV